MILQISETFRPAFERLSLLRRAGTKLRNFVRAESGAAAVYFVLSAPLWIGGLGLGAEVGTWYFFQQHLQSTADAVADSLAGRIGTGASDSELMTLANHVLTNNRFDFARGQITLSTSSSGPVFRDGTTVEVRLTRSVRRMLTGFFQPGDFLVTASAVAEVRQATQGCVLALARTGVGISANAANVQVNGCEVLSNSLTWFGFSVPAGSALTADCARSAGGFQLQGTLTVSCPRGREAEAGFTLDPYVDLPEPDLNVFDRCHYDGRSFNWTSTSGPPDSSPWLAGAKYVRFCNNATLNIATGIDGFGNALFIFDNSILTVQNNTTVQSTRSSFYFVNGGRPEIFAPQTRMTFVAPTSGPHKGMLFMGARSGSSPANNSIAVGPSSVLRGALYFPASPVWFQITGNAGATNCTQIIGRTVTLSGSWQSSAPCPVSSGVRPIVASRRVRLTQ